MLRLILTLLGHGLLGLRRNCTEKTLLFGRSAYCGATSEPFSCRAGIACSFSNPFIMPSVSSIERADNPAIRSWAAGDISTVRCSKIGRACGRERVCQRG